MKNIRKGTRERGGGEGVKISTGKGGGGSNSTVFMPATLWSQQKKKRFVIEIKGKGDKRHKKKVVEQSHAQNK